MKTIDKTLELIQKKFGTPLALKRCREQAIKGPWESERAILYRYIPIGSKVLDIGCGFGRVSGSLSQDYDFFGLDICPGMARGARELFPNTEFQIGDIRNTNIEKGSFDGELFLGHGFSEIYGSTSRYLALKEIHRILRNEGIFVLSAPYRFLNDYPRLIYSYLDHRFIKRDKETEFGDIYLLRYGIETYFHIPSKRMGELLERVGFRLLTKIKKFELGDRKGKIPDCYFYICQKHTKNER